MSCHGPAVGQWWARSSDCRGSAFYLSSMLTSLSYSILSQLSLSMLHHLNLGFLQGMLQSSHDHESEAGSPPINAIFFVRLN